IVFFFQAEDGIRDFHVTGVQTCALPIYSAQLSEETLNLLQFKVSSDNCAESSHPTSLNAWDWTLGEDAFLSKPPCSLRSASTTRSEERRVGKECRYGTER